MLRLSPILLALLMGYVMYRFSAWRTTRTLDAASRPLDDPALRAMTARLAQALDLPRVRVFIYDISPVNGLAAHDGRIFLTQGFMRRYHAGEVTAPELAGVIAHELGHVALGHSRRRMIDFSSQNALKLGLSMVLGRIIPGIGPWIAGGIVALLSARLSRQDEFEADAYATALLIKSGIGVGPQISLFHKLGDDSGPAAWTASHPSTAERIQAIEANALKWGG